MIFALVVLVLLGFSVLLNVGHLMRGLVPMSVARTHSVGPRLEEVVTEDNDASAKIAVIEVDGIITSQAIDQGGFSLVDVIKAQLKRAEEDDRVKAVILKVDSPGGEVLASDEISRAIADFQTKRHGKPVVCSMGSLAASGGYYVSAPCRWIVANDLTITGSIGVILSTWNYRGLMNKVGLRPETFKSGKYKDMLSGSRDPDSITPEEREMVQALVDETYGKFKNAVASGRKRAGEKNKDKGRALAEDWADYADGRILSGTEAFKLGFVDELGTFEDAVKRAKSIAGICGTPTWSSTSSATIFPICSGSSARPRARSSRWTWAWRCPSFSAGQLYFLSPTFLH